MKRAFGRKNESGLNRNRSVIANRHIWVIAAAFGALALLMALPSGNVLAAASCSTTISSCGCTITSPGFYQVTANLSNTQGLTSAGDCIDVDSVGVTLWLNGHSIAGSGSGGAGIELGSVGTFVEGGGGSIITGWNYGVELKNAIQVTMDNLGSDANATAGVYLSNSINNTISLLDVEGNGLAGMLLDHSNNNNINGQFAGDNFIGNFLVSSSNNQINNGEDRYNAGGGIVIGCSGAGRWPGCKSALPSNGNQIYSTSNDTNGFGIIVEGGNHKNVITGNEASGNNIDMADANPSCDQDLWFGNTFTTAVPSSCIH